MEFSIPFLFYADDQCKLAPSLYDKQWNSLGKFLVFT